MDKYIISLYPVPVSAEDLLRILQMKKDGEAYEEIAEMHGEAMEIARPVSLYAPMKPEPRGEALWLNNVEIPEPFVYKMLSGCERVVPYVATCGAELDNWSKKFTDSFEIFVADAIKQLCLFAMREKLFEEVKSNYFNNERQLSTLNPGSLQEWPISGQLPLFALLGGVTADIGVVLNDSLLMLPTKSISGVIFQSEEAFENCQLCPRVDCPGRRAEYVGWMD